MILFENHVRSETERLVPDLFSFFKNASHEVKASSQFLSFSISWLSSTWTYKKKTIKDNFRQLNHRHGKSQFSR